ncbi:MAG TPA: hypothetical protein DCL21_01570 [Alphaproteobacteria bacterium]|nr:hypothetical protein [Alphaproteobacteria bacterium]
MINKKGAMFGLDARISLAIFAALSVISGAALYSAIKQVKVTAVYTEFQELIKAYEAYYLDTGAQLPVSASIFRLLDLVEDSSIAGWNGPYLSHDKHFSSLKSIVYPGAILNGGLRDVNGSTCSAGEVCYFWPSLTITTYSDDKPQIVDALKDVVGADNHYYTAANLGQIPTTPRYHYVYVKGIPVKNPL